MYKKCQSFADQVIEEFVVQVTTNTAAENISRNMQACPKSVQTVQVFDNEFPSIESSTAIWTLVGKCVANRIHILFLIDAHGLLFEEHFAKRMEAHRNQLIRHI